MASFGDNNGNTSLEDHGSDMDEIYEGDGNVFPLGQQSLESTELQDQPTILHPRSSIAAANLCTTIAAVAPTTIDNALPPRNMTSESMGNSDDNKHEGNGVGEVEVLQHGGPKAVRQHKKENDALYSNFTKAGKDKSGNTILFCNHCEADRQKKAELYANGRASFKPKAAPSVMRKHPVICKSHLEGCKHYKRYLENLQRNSDKSGGSTMPDSVSTNPGTPVSTLSGSSKAVVPQPIASNNQLQASKKRGTLTDYYPLMYDAAQAKALNELVLEYLIDTAQPFNVIERRSFHRLVNFLQAGASDSLVGRHTIGGSRLEARAKEALQRRDLSIAAALHSGHYGGYVVNGWEQVNAKHVEGVLFKLGNKFFLLTALPGGDSHTGFDYARSWEEDIINGEEGIKYKNVLKYFLSDDAGQCAKARRILAYRHPYMLFACCWAHQVNLMVGHLLTSTEYNAWISKAVTAASKVKKSSSKWYK